MTRCHLLCVMRRSTAAMMLTWLIAGGVGLLVAQDSMNPPVSGFRAELLTDLARLEQKLVGLAEAIPEEDFSWRPVDSVRATQMHEPLGQSVADARSVGVVPPWSQPVPDQEE